jgi:chaperone modulatory protein CbpM
MNDPKPITGEVLDETVILTLHEVCRVCGTREEIVVEMVHEGVVEPLGARQDTWRFSGVAVARIRTALRLQHDLDVNLPGAALVLELLEEIESLRRRYGR